LNAASLEKLHTRICSKYCFISTWPGRRGRGRRGVGVNVAWRGLS
jgi:hypothetical protein